MTTVIYHRGYGLYADNRMTDGSVKLPDCCKLHRVGDGVFAASLGNAATGYRMITILRELLNGGSMVGADETDEELAEWLDPAVAKAEALVSDEDESHATLIVVDLNSPNRALQFTSRKGSTTFFTFARRDPFLAWGSGGDFAAGALEAGARPEKAIKLASKRDLGTGPAGHFVAPWSLAHRNPIGRFS